MINLSPLANQMLFSSVRIEAQIDEEERTVSGTAFFYSETDPTAEKKRATFLVSNWHTVKDSSITRVNIFAEDASGAPSNGIITLSFSRGEWIRHPGGLDLCVIPVSEYLAVRSAFCRFVTPEHLVTKEETFELLTNEPIVMFGFPLGLGYKSAPMARSGWTASHPGLDVTDGTKDEDDPYGNDSGPYGLADITACPGSSGSPICLLSDGGYTTKDGFVNGSRFKLLGVLTQDICDQEAVWGHADDEPRQLKLSVNSPARLAIYIKARALRELMDHVLRPASVEESNAGMEAD